MKKQSYNLYDIILEPIMSEKSSNLMASNNKYTFLVSKRGNKTSIAKAVEFIFSVKVKDVNILNIKARKVKFKGVVGRVASAKKAIVTLNDDCKLHLFEGA
jgi:large subunit ribosomal protein L23